MKRTYLGIDGFRDLIKSNPEPGSLDVSDLAILHTVTPEIRAVGGDDSLTLEFVISDDSVDRQNDTIAVDGWDFADYRRNPVVLFGHSHWDPPIGKSRSVYIEGNLVKSIAEFTPQDLNPLGYMVYQLFKKGFMHAVSVGFKPSEYTYAEDRKYGINFIKQSLLEYSAVPVPANPNALVAARSAGVDMGPMKMWAGKALDLIGRSTEDVEERAQIEVLRTTLDTSKSVALSDLSALEVTEPEVKTELPTTLPEGDPLTEADPPTDPPVKDNDDTDGVIVQVTERFLCGVTGCNGHDDRAEAACCRSADQLISETLAAFETMTKAGRVLSAANESRLRTALASLTEVLSQLDAQDDEDEKGDDTEGITIIEEVKSQEPSATVIEVADEDSQVTKGADAAVLHASPADLRAALTDAVSEAVRAITGRVD